MRDGTAAMRSTIGKHSGRRCERHGGRPTPSTGLRVLRRARLVGGLLVGWVALGLGCHGTRPADLGEVAGALRACPPSPNCVSSDAHDADHAVAPIRITAPPEQAWAAAVRIVSGWDRTELVRSEAGYLHVECTSALMRFVDDLELVLRPAREEIAVRSASRLGYSDLGANRRRVERLRAELVEAGVAAP